MSNLIQFASLLKESRKKAQHQEGFEPMTSRHQGICSTAVLEPQPIASDKISVQMPLVTFRGKRSTKIAFLLLNLLAPGSELFTALSVD